MRLAIDARKLTDYGIGTYLSHLIKGIASTPEVRLTLLGRGDHVERLSLLAPDARVLPVASAGYTVGEHVRLPAVLWKESLDLVHIPHYVVPLLLPKPVVATVHDVIQLFYPPAERPQLALLYLRAMMRSALRRARVVITVSKASRRDLMTLFGADQAKVAVVPNGVEDRLATRPAEDELEALKARFGLRPPLVMVVGNDKAHKNFDLVLRAFALARRRHALPGQLVFVGGLGPENRFVARAERLGIADRLRFLGRVSQPVLDGLYHLSAVLLHVALYEGFGLPVLEAMRAGLPVITSNLGAMVELGEGSARLVNPLDVDEVAAALGRVLVDDPLRRRMIEAGRKRSERFTLDRMVEGTMAVYRRAVGEV